MRFKGKRFLITQSALRNLSGSEIVTLELASFLKEEGASVTVFTWFYDNPIKEEFEKRGITVTTDEEDSLFDKLDYVWIHHQVLPQSIIKKLGQSKYNPPHFIFFHMSYMEDLFLEQPYILNLEKNLADKSIFVSEECFKMNMGKYGSLFRKPSIFSNFSPNEYITKHSSRSKLQKVGVVSNHPPKEVLEAIDLLNNSGVHAELIGNGSEKYTLVTADLLKQYDCIITIGKTVQYCLTMSIPVYIYDKFGGCGFLTKDNFDKALYANFSGRGFSQKTATEIAMEIINGYNDTNAFQFENHKMFQQKFSLQNNLEKLLSDISDRKIPFFSSEYINYLIAAETLVKEKIVAENTLVIILPDNRKRITELETANSNLNSIIIQMENSRIIKLDKAVRRIPSAIKNRLKLEKKETTKINYKDFQNIIVNKTPRDIKIVGLILERNESLMLDDTLTELEKIVDGFVLLDDCSTDNSIDIAKKHPKCLAIIKHLKHATGNRSMEESINRQLLLNLARKYKPSWIIYQDADERFEDGEKIREYILNHTDDDISGIRFSLFDAYMTKNDNKPYKGGPLLNYRKYFGPERRDILMAWKNTTDAVFINRPVMREPDGIDLSKLVTKFYVQHYGKSLSVEQWEETCDYYVDHFPQYAEKWKARKGKGIHQDKSDFGAPLYTWEEVKKNGGIKIN